ncbi:MAG: hypothetical protein QOJ35_994 [Solirubrobacteraceae bacterium]|jgi:hypothetical protein|nr:hypothetical protein [Solirubrobacteraceae bacterium]
MAEEDRLSVQQALELDDEALLEELGAWLLGDGPGFGPSDVDRKIRFAQSWLTEQRDVLRRRICGDVHANLKAGDAYEAMIEAATLADAVAAALGRPPANIVAVILLKRGLDRLCEDA